MSGGGGTIPTSVSVTIGDTRSERLATPFLHVTSEKYLPQ